MRRLLHILFLIVLPLLLLDGKNISYYPIEGSVPQSSVTCLYLDTRGFLWVGTEDGLNRYDGYNFLSFRNQPFDSTSISNNYITCLTEDLNGNIWVGTKRGVNIYLRNEGWFNRITFEDGIYSEQIQSIKVDSQGEIWIKTNCSIEEFNLAFKLKQHVYFKEPLHNDDALTSEYSNSLQVVSNKIYLADNYTLNVYDSALTNIYKREFKSLKDPIKGIYPDKGNNFWFVTNEGLVLFNLEDFSLKKYSKIVGQQYFDLTYSNYLFQDTNSDIWIATNDNILVYSSKDSVIHEILKDEKEYSINGIKSILIDNTKNLWVGAQNGLYKIDLKPEKFTLLNERNLPGISGNNIISVFNDGEHLWLGTAGNGLNIYNLETSRNLVYSLNNRATSKISGDYIYSIEEDVLGNIWVGTENGVDYISDKQFNDIAFKRFNPNVFNSTVYSIFSDSDSVVWFCLVDSIYSYNLKNNSLINVLNSVDSIDFKNLPPATCGSRISKDVVWFGTHKGILEYNISKQKIVLKNNSTEVSGFLSDDEVIEIFKDSKDRIWVGTASGLNLWNPYSKSFIYYAEKDGLPNNYIYDIVEDKEGELWISTNTGITEFNPETEMFVSYEVNRSLSDFIFNPNTGYISSNGTVYFGGNKGLNYFQPDSVKLDLFIAPIQVSSIKLFYKNGLREEVYSELDEIQMGKQVSMIQFEFALLDYTETRKNKYSFKLEKASENSLKWIDIGYQRDVFLANLEPGDYVLNVKAANSMGNTTNNSRSIHITVYRPLWKTKKAIILYIILIIALLYYLYLYRTKTLRKLNKEYKERERINKQIAVQKEQLAIKNKNITDSINYAKRIQEALMPSKTLFNKLLGDSFVLYKPKDIVSGDFYWIAEKNGKILLAAVDCTGHGVPGAFMSIIGFELFKKITSHNGIDEPAQILNALNENFKDIFRDVDNFTLRDGMDIAFCVLDRKKMILEFSGAFNPLYIIRDNKLSEVKGDRFSVGLDDNYPENEQSFTNHSISLEKDDIVYIFSDGYADQFGGPEAKKFKYRRFRHLLLTIHKLPMESQQNLLEKTMEEWRGDLDQVDDILIIGFRV